MLRVACCMVQVFFCIDLPSGHSVLRFEQPFSLSLVLFYGRIPAGANAHLAHSAPGLTCNRQHHIRPHMKFSLYVAFSACCRAFVLQGVSRHGMRHARAHVRETYRRSRHCALYGERAKRLQCAHTRTQAVRTHRQARTGTRQRTRRHALAGARARA